MAKYIKQKCVHCLKYCDELTEDHIFPRSWYPDSTPLNMEKWTVPSCKKCNQELGRAEEEFFDRFLFCINEKDIPLSVLNAKLRSTPKNKREAGRQEKFLMDTLKNFITYPYEEGMKNVLKNGTPKEGVRTKRMIRIPGDKLFLVSNKIIRGLEYKLRNRLIEENREIYLVIPSANNKSELELIEKWKELIESGKKCVHRGPGFIVSYGVNSTDNDWVIYGLTLWNNLEIWAMVGLKHELINK